MVSKKRKMSKINIMIIVFSGILILSVITYCLMNKFVKNKVCDENCDIDDV
jgi:hypothetical protein